MEGEPVVEFMDEVVKLTPATQLEPILAIRVHREIGGHRRMHLEYAPITKRTSTHDERDPVGRLLKQTLLTSYATGTYTPMPGEILRDLGGLLHQEKPLRLPMFTGLTPDLVHFYSPDASGQANLLIEAKAAVRFSQFANRTLVGVDDADIALPRCVMMVRSERLQLFAVKNDGQPLTNETPLFVPPTLNVSVTGSVCMGSMIRPEATKFTTVEQLAIAWLEMFFLSKGSHEHGAGLQVLSDKNLSLVDLYKRLIQEKAEVFPDELLQPVPNTSHYKTVGDLRSELITLSS